MKQMKVLIKNESIKLWKKTSTRVILIVFGALILLIAAITGVINNVLGNLWDMTDTFLDNFMTPEQLREVYAEEYEEYKASGDTLMMRYYEAEMDAIDFFVENRLIGTWKEDAFFRFYRWLCLHEAVNELLESKQYTVKELLESAFVDYIEVTSYPTPEIPVGAFYQYIGGSDSGLFDQEIFSDAGFSTEKDTISAWNIEEEEQKILYYDVTEQHLQFLTAMNEYIALLEQSQKECEQTYSVTENVILQYQAECLQTEILYCQKQLEILELFIDERVDFDDYRYITYVDEMVAVPKNMANATIFSKEYYQYQMKERFDDYYDDIYDPPSYTEYYTEAKNELEQLTEYHDILFYSIVNDVVLPQLTPSPTKSEWESGLESAVSMIKIFMIILSGIMVAGEFSSGTIRLLVIRPRSRTKILTSKLLCLLYWSMLTMLAAFVFTLVVSLIFNGIGDIFEADLLYLFGNVIPVPSILYMFLKLLLMEISLLFYVSFAFMLSVVTEKTALAIALPLIVSTLLGSFEMIFLLLRQQFRVLDFTILPFLNLHKLLQNSVGLYLNGGSIFNLLFGGTDSLYYSIPLSLGILHFALFIGFMVVLSYVVFCRKQITK